MQLSQEQQKAAFTDSKKALCLAGAGSGKSRTLVGRVSDLIKNKMVSAYEIMCITFTRLAAKEMTERLEKEIGPAAHKIMTGTIHGMALKLLQTYGELVGLRPEKITVYGSFEEQFLLKEVAREIGFHDGYKWKKVKAGEVEAAFNLFYTTGHITTEEVSVKINVLMNAFFARCKENNALTYGTILTTFLRLIPHIYQYLNLHHILVDETQDNDPLQWEIINKLCKLTGASLFAVGDIRQSIFSFRGADPEYLIRNQHLFDLFTLKDNYRSSANIVEAANNLISHNSLNMGEPMRAIRDGLNVSIQHLTRMDSATIVELLKPHGAIKNTAILARNHWPLKKLSQLLNDAGIKHEYIGKKLGLVRSEEFRRFNAFLKLIVNPFDNFAFLLIKDYLGIDKDQYADIRQNAVYEAKSQFVVWKEGWNESGWVEEYKNTTDFHEIFDILKQVEFQFDPDEIFTFIYTWIIENPAGTIAQYLNWLATFDIQDEVKEDADCLQLQTIHSAKGLEFSTVIIIGLNEEIFPSKQSIKKNELEDETRLMYVALTRGENQVILTSRPIKKDDSGHITEEPSRFIEWSLS